MGVFTAFDNGPFNENFYITLMKNIKDCKKKKKAIIFIFSHKKFIKIFFKPILLGYSLILYKL